MKHYESDRDIIEMGEYYTRHVLAMTREALHEKSDIAAELGWRDMQIGALVEALEHIRGLQAHCDVWDVIDEALAAARGKP